MKDFAKLYQISVKASAFNGSTAACWGKIKYIYLLFVQAKGYNDKVSDEVTKAFSVLSMHGVLQVSILTDLVISFNS